MKLNGTQISEEECIKSLAISLAGIAKNLSESNKKTVDYLTNRCCKTIECKNNMGKIEIGQR